MTMLMMMTTTMMMMMMMMMMKQDGVDYAHVLMVDSAFGKTGITNTLYKSNNNVNIGRVKMCKVKYASWCYQPLLTFTFLTASVTSATILIMMMMIMIGHIC